MHGGSPDSPAPRAAPPGSDRLVAVGRLLRPRSIAIVGISPEPGSFGAAMLSSLHSFEYPGAIHLVSRSRSEVFGRPCVPTIDDLPMDVDLAVLCLPRAGIHDAVAACGRRGIGGVVVYASGFAEMGAAGLVEQDAIVETARRAGVALLGPNCLGFLNHLDGVALCLSLPEPRRDENPSVGFIAQSGAMMLAAADVVRAKGIGYTHIISTGNEAVAGVEDFLAELIEDQPTRVITLFVEQIRRPRLFLALAARARERGKPIVMFHSGRTSASRAATLSHTGALAGDFKMMAALCTHEGVILVDSFDELIDVAALLVRFPLPPTAGVGVVTNSGAFRGITFDVCGEADLAVPPLAQTTLDRVGREMPGFAMTDNPIDVGTQLIRTPQLLGIAVEAMQDDPAIGSVVAAVVLGSRQQAVVKARAAYDVMRDAKKPMAFAAIGGDAAPEEFFAVFADHRVPMFRSPERALRAMARMTNYGLAMRRWKERAASGGDLRDAVAAPPLPARGTLPEYLGKQWLAAAGIAVPDGGLARTLPEAEAIATRLGYPVVLKAQAADLPHKSDVGGVVVGIRDAEALRQAWERMQAAIAAARPDLRLDGILVERMSRPGLEFIVGARFDPAWGPVIAVGLGGVLVEILDDVRLMAPDVTEAEVVRELHRLRGAKLLAGARSAPPIDVDALATIVAKVAALMRAAPEVTEIDLNPVMVYPRGQGACALDALVVATPASA
jgi:acyl-CoA synthetase (NDP forming)